ncbi:MAG: nucleotidyltransferase family protein [Acidobacteriia bacterium]|nr:nucleotidyltransferase family protein [Terriglobia bacterium]
MTLASGLDIPSEAIAEICRRYHIVEMAVFGSTARGDRRPDSDIDVLVEFEPGVVWGWDYFGLEQELAQIFGRPVDLATKKWLKPKVRAEILRDARVVYAA